MGGSALRFDLQVLKATLERVVERPLESAAEEAGDEPVIGLLGAHERRAVTRLEGVDVDRAEPSSVDVIVAEPDFQRKTDPSERPPSIETDFTSGFQLGQRSMPVRTSHTSSRAAAISAAAPFGTV